MRRRAFLELAGASATTGLLAGCLGLGGPSADDAPDAETTTDATTTRTTTTASRTPTTTTATGDDGTATTTSTTADGEETTASTTTTTEVGPKTHERQYSVDVDHPATEGLGLEPTLGPVPAETSALIVEFQDLSCPYCAAFDAQTFPTLYSNLIQPGKATFVTREFPHVKPWTFPAVQALESTYARDEEAYWALKSHYYANQDGYTEDNVLERTRHYLATDSPVDADAVIRDVRAEAYSEAVERDLRVKEAAGVAVTPTFFLFRDGAYVTTVTGNQPYSVFENALDL
jgi:protein-disulfide isomerase